MNDLADHGVSIATAPVESVIAWPAKLYWQAWSTTLPDHRSPTTNHCPFARTCVASLVLEQPFLAPQTTTISTQRAVSANDAMTRNDDTNHVRPIRAANGASRVFVPEAFGHP